MRSSRTAWGLGIGLLGLLACSGSPETAGPVELRFAAEVDPTSYAVSYEQDIQWGSAKLERRYGAGYTLGVGDGSPGSARLDSMRATLSTPHGRQTLDARHLTDSEFALTVAPTGGPPTYADDAPVLEMPGMLEGYIALSRLMDFGFPALPDGPVEVGHRWTGQHSHPQIEAHVTATADATTDYLFAGWDTSAGVDCARIEGRLAATVTAPPAEHGATTEFHGTLSGELEWCFDPVAGALVSMSGETSSDGILTAAGNDTEIRQITRIAIDPVGTP